MSGMSMAKHVSLILFKFCTQYFFESGRLKNYCDSVEGEEANLLWARINPVSRAGLVSNEDSYAMRATNHSLSVPSCFVCGC